jgi:Protein of unknown function (DUF2586)
MNDVNILLGNGGLGRTQANDDNVRGLVMSMGATAPTGLAANVAKQLLQPSDAEALGITAAYDTTNTTMLRYHINEFFAMNPNGKLWIWLVAQATTMAAMVDIAGGTTCAVERLANATNGECKQYGVALNPATTYTPVLANGLDTDVSAAIPKAQALADKLFAQHMPCHIVLEGRSFSGTSAAASNLRALSSLNVTVCIAQDLDKAPTAANAVIKAHAAVGTLLGTSSEAKVSHNVGYVEAYPVHDVATGRWLNPGLSSNLALSSYTDVDLNTLNSKGFVFVRKFVGQAGAWWNDSHTCTLVNSDYYCMENVLVINKAVRKVYAGLLPKVNGPVKLSAAGKLAPEVVAMLQGIGKTAIDEMASADDCSAGDIYIDPNQNVAVQGKTFVRIKIVPIGTNREINVTIGFAASI